MFLSKQNEAAGVAGSRQMRACVFMNIPVMALASMACLLGFLFFSGGGCVMSLCMMWLAFSLRHL
ncbi:hypothetical protein [Xylella fastidiosa]|uniref:hypothetical protein n=1 Tax=Xylella fastidiosa TaxID=2371 RepID=UPI0012BAA8DC|nr:hypothetical protein [Xylella fastidiosa]